MKTQHTRGPWNCNLGNDSHLENDTTVWSGSTPVAEVLNDPHGEMPSPAWGEAAANARLIAAAPELLNVLEMAFDDLTQMIQRGRVSMPDLRVITDDMETVIAKAKGERREA